MDCLINMDINDFEYETVRQKVYAAVNSKHTCCECDQPVKKGQKYELFIGRDESGRKDVYYTCIDCLSVRNAFFYDFQFTALWDTLDQEFEDGNIGGECLAKNLLKCTESARVDIAKFIEKYNVEIDV